MHNLEIKAKQKLAEDVTGILKETFGNHLESVGMAINKKTGEDVCFASIDGRDFKAMLNENSTARSIAGDLIQAKYNNDPMPEVSADDMSLTDALEYMFPEIPVGMVAKILSFGFHRLSNLLEEIADAHEEDCDD